jgi:hypothetical protein
VSSELLAKARLGLPQDRLRSGPQFHCPALVLIANLWLSLATLDIQRHACRIYRMCWVAPPLGPKPSEVSFRILMGMLLCSQIISPILREALSAWTGREVWMATVRSAKGPHRAARCRQLSRATPLRYGAADELPWQIALSTIHSSRCATHH